MGNKWGSVVRRGYNAAAKPGPRPLPPGATLAPGKCVRTVLGERERPRRTDASQDAGDYLLTYR